METRVDQEKSIPGLYKRFYFAIVMNHQMVLSVIYCTVCNIQHDLVLLIVFTINSISGHKICTGIIDIVSSCNESLLNKILLNKQFIVTNIVIMSTDTSIPLPPTQPFISIHSSQQQLSKLQKSALTQLQSNNNILTSIKQNTNDPINHTYNTIPLNQYNNNNHSILYNNLHNIQYNKLKLRRPMVQSVLQQYQHTYTQWNITDNKSPSLDTTNYTIDDNVNGSIDQQENQPDNGIYIIKTSRPPSRSGLQSTSKHPIQYNNNTINDNTNVNIYVIEPRSDSNSDNARIDDAPDEQPVSVQVSDTTQPIDNNTFELQSIMIEHIVIPPPPVVNSIECNHSDEHSASDHSAAADVHDDDNHKHCIVNNGTTHDSIHDTAISNHTILPCHLDYCYIIYNYIHQHHMLLAPVLNSPYEQRHYSKQLTDLYHRQMNQCNTLLLNYNTITSCVEQLSQINQHQFHTINDIVDTCKSIQSVGQQHMDQLYQYIQINSYQLLAVNSKSATAHEIDLLYDVVGNAGRCIQLIESIKSNKRKYTCFNDIVKLIQHRVSTELINYCYVPLIPTVPISIVESVLQSDALHNIHKYHQLIGVIRTAMNILPDTLMLNTCSVELMLAKLNTTNTDVLFKKLVWLDNVGYKFHSVDELCVLLHSTCRLSNVPVDKIHSLIEFLHVNCIDLFVESSYCLTTVPQLNSIIQLLRQHKCNSAVIQQYIARLIHIDITQQIHYHSVGELINAVDQLIEHDRVAALQYKIDVLNAGDDDTLYSMKSALRYIDPGIHRLMNDSVVNTNQNIPESTNNHTLSHSSEKQVTDSQHSIHSIRHTTDTAIQPTTMKQYDQAVITTVASSHHSTLTGPLRPIRVTLKKSHRPHTTGGMLTLDTSNPQNNNSSQIPDSDGMPLYEPDPNSVDKVNNCSDQSNRRISVLNNRRAQHIGDDIDHQLTALPSLHQRTESNIADESLAAAEINDIVKSIRKMSTVVIVDTDNTMTADTQNHNNNSSINSNITSPAGSLTNTTRKSSSRGSRHRRSNSTSSTSSRGSYNTTATNDPTGSINIHNTTNSNKHDSTGRHSKQKHSPLTSVRHQRIGGDSNNTAHNSTTQAANEAGVSLLTAQMRLSSNSHKINHDESALINKQLLASRRSLRNSRRQTNKTVAIFNTNELLSIQAASNDVLLSSDTQPSTTTRNNTYITLQLHCRELLKLSWLLHSYIDIYRIATSNKEKLITTTNVCKNTINPSYDQCELKYDKSYTYIFKVYDQRSDHNVYLGEVKLDSTQLLEQQSSHCDIQYDILDVHRLNTDNQYINSGVLFVTDVALIHKSPKLG